jgi:hypothetical protein
MPGDEVPSISKSFGAAFLYENEIRELFGINVTGLNWTWGGQLYKTARRSPSRRARIRARLEANAAARRSTRRSGRTARASATAPAAGKPA